MRQATLTLATQLAALAIRLGTEIKTCVRPSHAGLARAWVSFGVANGKSGGDIQIHAAHNIASVTRLAIGRYRVTFSQTFTDAHYVWLAFARNAGNANAMKFAAARAEAEKKTRSYVELVVTTAAGTLSDSTEINLVVYR